MNSENIQITQRMDSIVLRAQPVKRRSRTIVKNMPLCQSIPSLQVVKSRKITAYRSAGKVYSYDKFHYKIEGLPWRALTLAELVEVHMRLGQFLQGEKQPDWLKL